MRGVCKAQQLWLEKSRRVFIGSGILLFLSGCSALSLPFYADQQKVFDISQLSEAQQKHFELSMHYIDSAHYDIAETKLLSVIEDYPNFPDAYNALGVVYERRGRVTEGSNAFYKAITLNPDYHVAVTNYGDLKCYVSGGDEIMQVAEGIKDLRVKSRLYTAATKCYISQGHYSHGREAIESAITHDAHYAWSYLYFAKIQEHARQYQDAKKSIDRFNDLNGYTQESAMLGYSINHSLSDPQEMAKYQHVLKTLFNSEI